MQRSRLLMLVLVIGVEALALVGGIVLIRRSGGAGPRPSSLLTTTMSPRAFGWWLVVTSLALLSLSVFIVARLHA